MKKIIEDLLGFMLRDWTLAEKILLIVCCVLIGMINGFFFSPIKKGFSVASNNGNKYHQMDEEFWLDDEE